MFNANFIGRVQINGSGDQYRTFIHVNKIARVAREATIGNVPSGTYNVAEHNLTINEITAKVKHLYPDLESIHVNYSIKMRDVQVSLPCEIWSHVPLQHVTLEDELLDFKRHFSF
jgi:UDP-glucose 4-epimerase